MANRSGHTRAGRNRLAGAGEGEHPETGAHCTAGAALHEGALAGTAAPDSRETAIDRSVRHSRAGDRRGRWNRAARMVAVEFAAHAHLRTSAATPGMVRAPLDDRIVAPRAQKRLPH